MHRLPLFLGLFAAPALFAQAEPIARACSAEGRRGLDFWIGSWTVTDRDGKPAGKSEITAITNGCALLERWESSGAGGFTFRGTGLHVFDPVRGVWKQLWTDTSGRAQDMEGEVKDGVAVYRWTDDRGGEQSVRARQVHSVATARWQGAAVR